MGRRILLIAALAALLPANAVARAPALGQSLVVSAPASGTMLLRVDQPVSYVRGNEQQEPRVTSTGPGKVRGLLLRREGEGEDEPGLFTWDGEMLAWPYSELDFASPVGTAATAGGARLPAGLYRLTFYTDAPGAVVALTLPTAPQGTLAVSELTRVPSVAGPIGSRVPLEQDAMAIHGRVEDLPERGLVLVAMGDGDPAATPGRLETCFYDPEQDADGPLAFAPGCPDGTSTTRPEGLLGFGGDVQARFDAAPGFWGLGGNAQNAQQPMHAFGAWVAWNVPLTEPPDAAPAPPVPVARAAKGARLAGRVALVRVGCTAVAPCDTRLDLGAGGSRVLLPAGTTRTVRVAVPRRLRDAVRRRGQARATLRLRTAGARPARVSIVLSRRSGS